MVRDNQGAMMKSPVIASFLITPDGTVLQSLHRHDFKTYVDTYDNEEYMIDGGCEYLRCSSNGLDRVYRITMNDDHKIRRKCFHWGTRGKDGKHPLTWKALQDLDTEHIQAILDTQHHIQDHIRELFKDELKYREQVS